MINYVRHIEIDKNRWDDCIRGAINRRVYAFSWYLDVVCPGWDALVEDDYISVFPLTHHHKWGIRYLYQPYFAQQLGVFSGTELPESTVTAFILAIPEKFRYLDIHLNSMNSYPGGTEIATFRLNHELNLAADHEKLTEKFAENTRRNIRKAQGFQITLTQKTDVGELVGLFRDNFGRIERKLKDCHYETLRRLLVHCLANHLGYITGAKTKDGNLSAAAFFLFDHAHVYLLFAASSAAARDNGAMFLLIDRFINDNAGRQLVLDFEGGNDPNLGRFYKSFGAVEIPYQTLHLNRLPAMVERGLYFIRKLRK